LTGNTHYTDPSSNFVSLPLPATATEQRRVWSLFTVKRQFLTATGSGAVAWRSVKYGKSYN